MTQAKVKTTITYSDAHSRVRKLALDDRHEWNVGDGLVTITEYANRDRGGNLVDPLRETIIPISRLLRIDTRL